MMPRSPDLAIFLLTDLQTYIQTDEQNDCFTPCTCVWDNYGGGGRGSLTVLIFLESYISLHEDPQFSCPCGSESRTRKLHLHYGDFVQANSKMADSTAGQLESALCVNKASAKAFEPRVT